jgi:hypothetical protein
MDQHVDVIRRLLGRVRARWQRLVWLGCAERGALALAAVLACGWLVGRWANLALVAGAALAVAMLAGAVVAVAWALFPARVRPSDARVARFVEERSPSLDDRLASAVHAMTSRADLPAAPSPLTGLMLADAARIASEIDPQAVIPAARLRRAAARTAASALILAAAAFATRGTIGRSFDALAYALVPSRVQVEVEPGNARLRAGSPLAIEARLVGNRAPVVPELLQAGDAPGDPVWRATAMSADAAGVFRVQLPAVEGSFK